MQRYSCIMDPLRTGAIFRLKNFGTIRSPPQKEGSDNGGMSGTSSKSPHHGGYSIGQTYNPVKDTFEQIYRATPIPSFLINKAVGSQADSSADQVNRSIHHNAGSEQHLYNQEDNSHSSVFEKPGASAQGLMGPPRWPGPSASLNMHTIRPSERPTTMNNGSIPSANISQVGMASKLVTSNADIMQIPTHLYDLPNGNIPYFPQPQPQPIILSSQRHVRPALRGANSQSSLQPTAYIGIQASTSLSGGASVSSLSDMTKAAGNGNTGGLISSKDVHGSSAHSGGSDHQTSEEETHRVIAMSEQNVDTEEGSGGRVSARDQGDWTEDQGGPRDTDGSWGNTNSSNDCNEESLVYDNISEIEALSTIRSISSTGASKAVEEACRAGVESGNDKRLEQQYSHSAGKASTVREPLSPSSASRVQGRDGKPAGGEIRGKGVEVAREKSATLVDSEESRGGERRGGKEERSGDSSNGGVNSEPVRKIAEHHRRTAAVDSLLMLVGGGNSIADAHYPVEHYETTISNSEEEILPQSRGHNINRKTKAVATAAVKNDKSAGKISGRDSRVAKVKSAVALAHVADSDQAKVASCSSSPTNAASGGTISVPTKKIARGRPRKHPHPTHSSTTAASTASTASTASGKGGTDLLTNRRGRKHSFAKAQLDSDQKDTRDKQNHSKTNRQQKHSPAVQAAVASLEEQVRWRTTSSSSSSSSQSDDDVDDSGEDERAATVASFGHGSTVTRSGRKSLPPRKHGSSSNPSQQAATAKSQSNAIKNTKKSSSGGTKASSKQAVEGKSGGKGELKLLTVSAYSRYGL